MISYPWMALSVDLTETGWVLARQGSWFMSCAMAAEDMLYALLLIMYVSKCHGAAIARRRAAGRGNTPCGQDTVLGIG